MGWGSGINILTPNFNQAPKSANETSGGGNATACVDNVCDGGIFWSDALISTGVLVSEKGHPSWNAGHFSLASSTSSPALAKGHSLGGAAILLQQFGAPQQQGELFFKGGRARGGPRSSRGSASKPCEARLVAWRRRWCRRAYKL